MTASQSLYSSEELTQELERLSGWKRDNPNGFTVGFLLRKLPEKLAAPKLLKQEYQFLILQKMRGQWRSKYGSGKLCTYAVTPEDALAKLCISLIKENILTKEAKQ